MTSDLEAMITDRVNSALGMAAFALVACDKPEAAKELLDAIRKKIESDFEGLEENQTLASFLGTPTKSDAMEASDRVFSRIENVMADYRNLKSNSASESH